MPLKVSVWIILLEKVAPVDNSFKPHRVVLEIGVGREPLSLRNPISVEDSHQFGLAKAGIVRGNLVILEMIGFLTKW